MLADELRETEALCRNAGGWCRATICDVRDRAAVEACVAAASAESGRVDILVNNAGGVLGQVGRPLEQVTRDEWQAIFDVNVTGAFYFSQAVAPGMKAAHGGRIINISSGAGLGISLTGIQAYASAKAAQIGMTRQLAHELGAVGHHRQQRRAGVRPIKPDHREAMGIVWRRGTARACRADRPEASRHTERHRPRRAVLRVRLCGLDYRPGALDRRWQMIAAAVLTHLRDNRDRTLGKLLEFASIPSVSTDPAHAADIERAARWVAAELGAAGPFAVRTFPTAGNPVVYGEWLGAPDAPTVLVYGHYDVQPPDPIEKWNSPPWTPTLRDGRVYARGVSDDKGPMLIPIAVAEAFFADRRRAADQRQVHVRGRGGDRQPPSRRLHRPAHRAAPRRCRRVGRRRDVANR